MDLPPPNSIILDIRPLDEYKSWHLENSVLLGPGEIEDYLKNQPSWKEFVILCTEGSLSAELASFFRKEGYNVYSIIGGAKRLRRLLEKKSCPSE